MMRKKELLLSYIKANVAPILVDFIKGEDFTDATILNADIDIDKLNCHYEGIEFVPPNWFIEISNKSTNKILIIDKIDSISKDEQIKFGEILKYRKVNLFDLPKDCIIIVTANKISKNTISDKILELVALI